MIKNIMKNKKGQLGLKVVQSVMVLFLILGVIGVATFLTMSSIRDVAEGIDTSTTTQLNVTTNSVINVTGGLLGGAFGLRNCVGSLTTVSNNTGSLIPATNYTFSGCTITAVDDVFAAWNNTAWNFSGSYTFSNDESTSITNNISDGLTGFFDDTGTIFAILVVVVIILAIAIVIAVVTRFGGGSGSIGGGAGSKDVGTVSGF